MKLNEPGGQNLDFLATEEACSAIFLLTPGFRESEPLIALDSRQQGFFFLPFAFLHHCLLDERIYCGNTNSGERRMISDFPSTLCYVPYSPLCNDYTDSQ